MSYVQTEEQIKLNAGAVFQRIRPVEIQKTQANFHIIGAYLEKYCVNKAGQVDASEENIMRALRDPATQKLLSWVVPPAEKRPNSSEFDDKPKSTEETPSEYAQRRKEYAQRSPFYEKCAELIVLHQKQQTDSVLKRIQREQMDRIFEQPIKVDKKVIDEFNKTLPYGQDLMDYSNPALFYSIVYDQLLALKNKFDNMSQTERNAAKVAYIRAQRAEA